MQRRAGLSKMLTFAQCQPRNGTANGVIIRSRRELGNLAGHRDDTRDRREREREGFLSPLTHSPLGSRRSTSVPR